MADQKISQLTGGGAAQATDEYVVARAGGNNKITGANVAAAATSVGTLTSLTVANTTAAATAASFSGNYNASGSVTVGNFQRSGGAVASAIKYHDATTSMSFGTTTAHTLTLRTNDTDRVSFDSSGNVNFDSNTLYVDAANNRVGVGTASPASTLTVSGDVHILSTNYLNFTNTAQQTYIRAPATSTIAFGTNSTEVMRLDASGNLGLGVTPSFPLQVLRSQAATTAISVDNNTGNAAAHASLVLHTGGASSGDPYIYFNNEVTNWSIGCDNSDSDKFKVSKNSTLGTDDYLTLDASGNLGVGTAPSYKLDVDGAGRLGLINRAGSYSAGTTTPSVTGVSYMPISNSSATTITNFTGGVAGQILFLRFADANTTINRSNAYLANSANFVSAANATLVLISDGSAWYEISRSTANG